MTHVVCEVAEGLCSSEASVTVRDYTGRPEYVPVDRSLLAKTNGRPLLAVRLVFKDESKSAALIELPNEADSGANRIWVRLADIKDAVT